jgi:hypothetical protein
MDIPIPIAKKIQRVKKRSKNPSFFRSAAGAQLVEDIKFGLIYF